MGEIITSAWARHVIANPQAVAVRYRDHSWTRVQLDEEARQFAGALSAHGIAQGDRIVLHLQNRPQFVIAVLGSWFRGVTVVCANPMYRHRELEHIVSDSGAKLLITEPESKQLAQAIQSEHDRLTIVIADEFAEGTFAFQTTFPGAEADEPIADICADHAALLTYTSGTTGPAKGALALHRNVAYGASVYRDSIGLDVESVVFAMAPLSHITGMIGHLAVSLYVGCRLILDGRFDPERGMRLMVSEDVTFTIGALTAYRALLGVDSSQRPTSVRALYSGGAPVTHEVAQAVQERFGVPLGNAYGLTEATSISHLSPPGAQIPLDPVTGTLSIGRPAVGTTARVLDTDGNEVPDGESGELAIRGPGIIDRYWNNEGATAAAMPDGELRTGDVVRKDSEGWYFVIDRLKDQINASGYKVWPSEVEDVLRAHDAVDEAVVYGVPDDYRGETVHAAITVHAKRTVDTEEVRAFARERLAAYKVPRSIAVVTAIPKTHSGKLLRRAFKAQEEAHGG